MEEFLAQLEASGFELESFLTTALVFFAASIVIGLLGRMLFGQRSALGNAVSSAIGILFIYVATVCVLTIGGELAQFQQFLSPLPFVSIEGEELHLFVLEDSETSVICSQVLGMVILAFLVNLLDSLLPRGGNVVTWFVWRCATVVLAILAHWLVTGLIGSFLPDVIEQNAATILLGLLVLMLAVGALKFLVGAAIATVNPLIGALYTFFFANAIGRQLSKAVLSTALLTGLVWGLNQAGIATISISLAALTAYVPFLIVLGVAWYLVNLVF